MSPRRFAAVLLPLALSLGSLPALAQKAEEVDGDDAVRRGEYVFNAAGCLGCHTAKDGEPLAGGRALETPFGTFYGPNITPDPVHGIGGWTEADFIRAMREGVAPDGWHYFPAFPYTAFTRMTDRDLRDLWAYLSAQPPVAQPDRPHDLLPPFGWRSLMTPWKALFFDGGPLPPEPDRDAAWNRGRYLVRALGHCGECHTPRNPLGALDAERRLAGTAEGPEGEPVPNLTPHPDGLGDWAESDIALLLELGMTPDGDFVGAGMNEVVEHSTSKLTAEDREAIAAYLKSLPPIPPAR